MRKIISVLMLSLILQPLGGLASTTQAKAAVQKQTTAAKQTDKKAAATSTGDFNISASDTCYMQVDGTCPFTMELSSENFTERANGYGYNKSMEVSSVTYGGVELTSSQYSFSENYDYTYSSSYCYYEIQVSDLKSVKNPSDDTFKIVLKDTSPSYSSNTANQEFTASVKVKLDTTDYWTEKEVHYQPKTEYMNAASKGYQVAIRNRYLPYKSSQEDDVKISHMYLEDQDGNPVTDAETDYSYCFLAGSNYARDIRYDQYYVLANGSKIYKTVYCQGVRSDINLHTNVTISKETYLNLVYEMADGRKIVFDKAYCATKKPVVLDMFQNYGEKAPVMDKLEGNYVPFQVYGFNLTADNIQPKFYNEDKTVVANATGNAFEQGWDGWQYVTYEMKKTASDSMDFLYKEDGTVTCKIEGDCLGVTEDTSNWGDGEKAYYVKFNSNQQMLNIYLAAEEAKAHPNLTLQLTPTQYDENWDSVAIPGCSITCDVTAKQMSGKNPEGYYGIKYDYGELLGKVKSAVSEDVDSVRVDITLTQKDTKEILLDQACEYMEFEPWAYGSTYHNGDGTLRFYKINELAPVKTVEITGDDTIYYDDEMLAGLDLSQEYYTTFQQKDQAIQQYQQRGYLKAQMAPPTAKLTGGYDVMDGIFKNDSIEFSQKDNADMYYCIVDADAYDYNAGISDYTWMKYTGPVSAASLAGQYNLIGNHFYNILTYGEKDGAQSEINQYYTWYETSNRAGGQNPEPGVSPTPGVQPTPVPTVKPGTPQTPGTTATPDNLTNTQSTTTVNKVTYKVSSNGTATVTKNANKKAKTIAIPATVKANGKTYKVTSIASSAYKSNTALTKVTISKNIKSIGKNAFYGCSKLKTLTIQSTAIKTISAGAFKKTYAKMKVKVPKSKKAAYKKLLKKAGLSSKAKVS